MSSPPRVAEPSAPIDRPPSSRGEPVSGRRVAYEWIREIYDYNWYQQNGDWRYRPTIYDEVAATGETVLDENGRGRLARRLDAGRFRLEVFDPASGSA